MGGAGLIIVLVVGLLFGVDITPFLSGGGQVAPPQANAPVQIDDETEEFVAVVLADTEAIWGEIFRDSGIQYTPPVLVLFAGRTQSACGRAMSATGPFYCPVDQRVYLDTSFFGVMEQRLGARGDFAKAYVIAHEVAHHVQHSLGILEQVNRAKQRSSQADANALSVRVELQADCYSGVWARLWINALGCWNPVTSKKRSTRPLPSGMTHCNALNKRWWSQTALPTAPVNRGKTGFTGATNPETPTAATPSPQDNSDFQGKPMKSQLIAAVCTTMTPVLGSIAALSISGALGSEVAAQQCGASGDLIYIGRTRGEHPRFGCPRLHGAIFAWKRRRETRPSTAEPNPQRASSVLFTVCLKWIGRRTQAV